MRETICNLIYSPTHISFRLIWNIMIEILRLENKIQTKIISKIIKCVTLFWANKWTSTSINNHNSKIGKFSDYFDSMINIKISEILPNNWKSIITLFAASTLTPFDRSNSTTAVCPLEAAIIRAVPPSYKTAEELMYSW